MSNLKGIRSSVRNWFNKVFFKKKVGQVIVKGPCSTDQRLIFIEVWKENKKLKNSQRKYLMGLRNNRIKECIEREKVFMTIILVFMN